MEEYAPEFISAFVLKKLMNMYNNSQKRKYKKVVITVPAYFNNNERNATIAAAKIAGLQNVTLINEPTAAAFAYKFENSGKNQSTLLVFDLGGGTFDVTVLLNKENKFIVQSSHGDIHLGGRDFDRKLYDLVVKKYKAIDINVSNDNYFQNNEKIIKLKIDLSTADEASVVLVGVNDEEVVVTRDEFEIACKELIDRCIEIVMETLQMGNIKKENIQDILLVGGSSRMPWVKEKLQSYFNQDLSHNYSDFDLSVAIGASIYAYSLSSDKPTIKVKDIITQNLGIEVYGKKFSPIINAPTTIPIDGKQMYQTAETGKNTDKALVQIYQGFGESTIEKINPKICKLGSFEVSGWPSIDEHILFEISINVTIDGTIVCKAKNTTYNIEESLTTKYVENGLLNSSDIDKYINKMQGGGSSNQNNSNSNSSKLPKNLETLKNLIANENDDNVDVKKGKSILKTFEDTGNYNETEVLSTIRKIKAKKFWEDNNK